MPPISPMVFTSFSLAFRIIRNSDCRPPAGARALPSKTDELSSIIKYFVDEGTGLSGETNLRPTYFREGLEFEPSAPGAGRCLCFRRTGNFLRASGLFLLRRYIESVAGDSEFSFRYNHVVNPSQSFMIFFNRKITQLPGDGF